MICFGWNISFPSEPNPKEAQLNNQSVMQFPEYVSHYVENQLVYGSIISPFKPGDLLFRFFRRPFGSVPKSNSRLRCTIIDYSNISYEINSYNDSRSHRSAPWKLFLPNLVSIVRAILQTRQLYPNQRVVMWKCNMAGWYCLMLLDPSKVPFFAIMWQNQVLIDPTLLFSNRGAALAAQRFILAIVQNLQTKLGPHQGTCNKGIFCRCTSQCDCGENTALTYIDVLGLASEFLAEQIFSFDRSSATLDYTRSCFSSRSSLRCPRSQALFGLEYGVSS